jgi:hypothetical protein
MLQYCGCLGEEYHFNNFLDINLSDNGAISKLVNVRVQLSYGPFVQILFSPQDTIKEMFKTVVHRIHLRNSGNYYLYLLVGDAGV